MVLSIDSVEDHNLWKKDIEDVQGTSVNYPLIADEDLKIAKLYNMLPAEEKADSSRTAMNNATVRSVFLIDPDKKIRMMLTYPMTTGRNFEEILRVLDSVQLTSKRKVATPANWKKNEKVIIVPAVSDEEAKETFGEFEKIKPYLRFTKTRRFLEHFFEQYKTFSQSLSHFFLHSNGLLQVLQNFTSLFFMFYKCFLQ